MTEHATMRSDSASAVSAARVADLSSEAPERLLLTAEEVSELIGMGVDWIYEQARRGHIPVVKLGRYRRFRRQSIEKWITENER